jgi:hypothetical protein
MLHTRWSAEAWPQVKTELKKALALSMSRGADVSALSAGRSAPIR